MKKRLLSVLLCFVMVLGLLPVTAYADIPENMNTWGGKQITHVEFTAYYKDDLTADSYAKARNTLVTGEPVNPYQIQFVPTSLTWKQGANGAATNKIIAQENGTNGWRAVMTDNSVELQDMTGNRFPLYAESAMYWRNGNWSSGAERWDRVYESNMPNYTKGEYSYRLHFEVLSRYLKKDATEAEVLNQYRIAPNVTVTVKWLNSDVVTENFRVHPGGGMGICNYKEDSMFTSTAGFLSSTISVTGTGPLQMGNSGRSIASVYAGEEIKPLSVVDLVSGGTAPYTFTKESGPAGIIVDANGTVHGAPTDECSTTQTLTVKVTDATGAFKTATIDVEPVKAARTVIQTIVLDGLYKPNANDEPATNRAYIVSIKDAVGHEIKDDCHLYISEIMSDWWVKDGQDWKRLLTGLFKANKQYQYHIQFRIDNDEACTEYRMADNMTVTAPGFSDTSFSLGTYFDEDGYQCRYVYSPEVTAGTAIHLNGSILYTGAARFGVYLNAHVADDLSDGAEGYPLVWQWQYKTTSGDWMNFGNASTADWDTAVSLNLGEDETYLMGKLIRAVAYSTNPDFSGAIYGAPLTVEKGWNMGIPTAPVIEPQSLPGSSGIRVTDASRNPEQEYRWTTSPSVDANGIAVWPEDETNSTYLASTTPGTTYYVYTRFEETATMEAGRIVSAAMYTVPTPKDDGAGSNTAQDLYYPDYASKTPTVYVPKNGSVTITYAISSDTVNPEYNQPKWKGSYDILASTGGTVDVEVDHAAQTLKITAHDKIGGANVTAYKNDALTELWQYSTDHSADGRQIRVEVYNPADLTTIPFPTMPQDLGTVTLFKGDSHDIDKSVLLALSFVPNGISKDGYTLSAKFTTYGTGGSSGVITYSAENDYVGLSSSSDSFTVTGDKVTGSSVRIDFSALPSTTDENFGQYRIAYLKVKVIDRPALTNFVVTPSAVTLNPGDTYQLRAAKTPTDNSTPVSWSSWDTNVATVDSTTGVVTAVSEGTTNVYATCGDTAVYSVVTVKAVCESHSFYYVSVGDYGHKGICVNCGYTEDNAAARPTGTRTRMTAVTQPARCTACAPPAAIAAI